MSDYSADVARYTAMKGVSRKSRGTFYCLLAEAAGTLRKLS